MPSTVTATAAASAAPALTPGMPGSASGLRVTPCMTAPASPSDTPPMSPIRVRGPRTSRTISCAWSDAS